MVTTTNFTNSVDYLFDDTEDFYTNVDYTLPDSFDNWDESAINSVTSVLSLKKLS